MPGYTEPLEPEPTKEKKEIKSRFAMPTNLTIVQMVLLAFLVIHAWTSRKVKGVVVSTVALAIGLLHMYDHLYRVKRGGERLFFLPGTEMMGHKKEHYGCKSCM
tara:strand:+ start:723 stop:1034 length:312 start_codon:yes stop_codon:yes gene_type:complete